MPFLNRSRKQPAGMLGVKENRRGFILLSALVVLILLVAVLAPATTPQDPTETHMTLAFERPGPGHIMGTDRLGRDMFSRVIAAAHISVPATLALVAIILTAGTALGILAGYFGGVLDAVIMRIADMMISFPGMVLAIAVVSWTKYARLARSLTLKIRHEDYVAAALTTGSRTGHILWRYMLPGVLPTMVVTAASDVGGMMLELAGLSFLGFGAQPPNPEWGLMLSEGRPFFIARPWLIVYPGLAIVIVVSIFNLWGDSLRDVLDPKA